jgi:hypothetical protein
MRSYFPTVLARELFPGQSLFLRADVDRGAGLRRSQISEVHTVLHNPDLDGHLKEVDEVSRPLFKVLEPSLVSFAERRSLFVRKWLHNYPMWGFFFRHPLSGTGSLQLSIYRQDGMFVAAVAGGWYVDDQDKLQRTTLWFDLETLPSLDSKEVVEGLEGLLSKILTSSPSARSRVSQVTERRKDEAGQVIPSDFEKSLQVPT